MILSQEQNEALMAITRWYIDPSSDWQFFLGGYAGTGKTTLLGHFINGLEEAPVCLAPTGKAASVLAKKLPSVPVTTIHSAIYKPLSPSAARLEALLWELQRKPGDTKLQEEIRQEKIRLAKAKPSFTDNADCAIIPGSLVIVDEASMVGTKMREDLKRTDAKVLFVGDPGQLPPVGDEGFFTRNKPDFILTQVQRQALENPIIRLSMDIRKGNYIPDVISNEKIEKHSKRDFPLDRLLTFDQILTGKNVVRHKINRMCRKMLGYYDANHSYETTYPQKAGEKLIALKNQFRCGAYFINGVQCVSTGGGWSTDNTANIRINIEYEGEKLSDVPIYPYNMEVHYNSEAEQEPWEMRKDLVEIDYAYAVTVHKSQGSEWDKVALVDDNFFMNDPRARKRWLYTAVTRAKDSLVWLTEN